MKAVGRVLRLGVVALLLSAVIVTHTEAGRRHGGHGGSHHHGRSHGHGRVIIGVGPWWGPGWWGWPYYYPYYPSYPYYPYSYAPPVVTEPSTYIQRDSEIQTPPPAYWYYCESAAGYYPAVQSCPESWLKVAPREQ